jgi:hypothetical protein
MGWDGYACRVKFDDYYKEDLLERLSSGEAAPLLAKMPGAADAFGESIHVGTRAIARALSKATGAEPYNLEWWPAQVRELARNANWDFLAEDVDEECKNDARLFLEICAQNDLGIRFD